ncbi:MAG: phosphomannomutase/phosphoglucomutase [bacterium]|nr:phosphomannomutase/phosphoglucomutase [bacterium]
MKINPAIFKAYDIRGVFPEDISKEAAYLIGRAFTDFLKKRNPKIAVGRDNRLSSPALFKSLVRGMVEEGATVVDIGLATSPMFYWAVAFFKLDGGINITASHNPSKYNGFKMVREKAMPISENTGIKEIQKAVLKRRFKKKPKGRIIRKKVLKSYIKASLNGFSVKKTRPLKVVIDTANAVSGIIIPKIFRGRKDKITHLFSKLEGSFPNHSPNPLIKENLKTIRQAVKNQKADLGIAFDGDGDRLFFIDEKAEIIPGDLIIALMAGLVLAENPGEKILYDVRSSNIVPETVKAAGGIPVVWKIGHSFIKEKMRKEDIVFAGELSGHYYLRSNYFCEAPLYVFLKIMQEVSESGLKLSQMIKPFRKYFHSGEINFKVKDKKMILARLERKFKSGKILKLDGLRIDFKDWWFLVRPSNTEPLLRLVVEAKTKNLLSQKRKELTRVITS